jgi:hypothetical protein
MDSTLFCFLKTKTDVAFGAYFSETTDTAEGNLNHNGDWAIITTRNFYY